MIQCSVCFPWLSNIKSKLFRNDASHSLPVNSIRPKTAKSSVSTPPLCWAMLNGWKNTIYQIFYGKPYSCSQYKTFMASASWRWVSCFWTDVDINSLMTTFLETVIGKCIFSKLEILWAMLTKWYPCSTMFCMAKSLFCSGKP